MAQSMIELVRDAIHAVLLTNKCDEAVCKFSNGCGCAIDGARAAISAMRITEESNPEDNGGLLGGFATFGSPAQIWNARIDEALGEGEQ